MKNGQSLLEPLSTTRERSQAQQPVKTERSKRRRGITWVLGSFLFCPCHLPITLGILAAVFGGTALGAFFIRYSIIAGVIITLLWLAGTWYGFRLLRAKSPTACAIR